MCILRYRIQRDSDGGFLKKTLIGRKWCDKSTPGEFCDQTTERYVNESVSTIPGTPTSSSYAASNMSTSDPEPSVPSRSRGRTNNHRPPRVSYEDDMMSGANGMASDTETETSSLRNYDRAREEIEIGRDEEELRNRIRMRSRERQRREAKELADQQELEELREKIRVAEAQEHMLRRSIQNQTRQQECDELGNRIERLQKEIDLLNNRTNRGDKEDSETEAMENLITDFTKRRRRIMQLHNDLERFDQERRDLDNRMKRLSEDSRGILQMRNRQRENRRGESIARNALREEQAAVSSMRQQRLVGDWYDQMRRTRDNIKHRRASLALPDLDTLYVSGPSSPGYISARGNGIISPRGIGMHTRNTSRGSLDADNRPSTSGNTNRRNAPPIITEQLWPISSGQPDYHDRGEEILREAQDSRRRRETGNETLGDQEGRHLYAIPSTTNRRNSIGGAYRSREQQYRYTPKNPDRNGR